MCVCVGSFVKEFRGNVRTTIVFVALLLYVDNKGMSHKSLRARANILLHFFFCTIEPGQYMKHF